MKGSRPKLISMAIGTVVFLVLVILWLQARAPVYQGRPLTAWLEDVVAIQNPMVVWRADYARRSKGEEAVVQMGTRAVPALTRLMRARDSVLRLKVVAFCAKRPWLRFHFRPPADKLQYWGTRGIGLLGPVGKAAVPELRGLLSSPFPQIRVSAATALGKMGINSTEAVPQLITLSLDPDPKVRAGTCRALGDLKRIAKSAMPALIHCLSDTNFSVFSAALTAANRIGADSSLMTLPLTGQLLQGDPRIRYDAAIALGDYGAKARTVIPELLKAVQDTNNEVRDAAAWALFEIDAETAIKTGVLPPPASTANASMGSVTLVLDALMALDIYKTIAGVELVQKLPSPTVPGLINLRGTLSPNEAAEFMEKVLFEQAGIVLERIDEKHVAVKMRHPK
jgi:HEAT repeat protein